MTTHCQRVLDLLSDGQPHDHHSLYALNVIAHSRISDLRKRGHTIEMWREGDSYFYRLTDSAAGRRPSPPSEVPPRNQVDRVDDGPHPSSTPAAVQLRLVA